MDIDYDNLLQESDEDFLYLDKIIPRLKQKGSNKTEEDLKNIISTTIKYTCNVDKHTSGKGMYSFMSIVNTTSPITDMGMNIIQDYIKKTNIRTKNGTPYMGVYHPGKKNWQVIHRMIGESLELIKRNVGMQCHHIDKNILNIHPSNLLPCSKSEHLKLHSN